MQAAHSTVALDLRAPEHASPLPLAAARRFPRARPAPEPRRVGTRRVWGYELPGKVDGTRAVSLSLPTTRGVVTIACETDEAELRLGLRECTDAMSAVGSTAPTRSGPRPRPPSGSCSPSRSRA